MATFNSPKTREVNLALYSDGSWKIISDLPLATVAEQVSAAAASVSAYASRIEAGEPDKEDTDEDEPGVVATTVNPEPVSTEQLVGFNQVTGR